MEQVGSVTSIDTRQNKRDTRKMVEKIRSEKRANEEAKKLNMITSRAVELEDENCMEDNVEADNNYKIKH